MNIDVCDRMLSIPDWTSDAGVERKRAANEQCSSLVSMYMFIEFGRLGCKHVIYPGDVYVR